MFYVGVVFVRAGIQSRFPMDGKEFSEARRGRQPPRGRASRLGYSHKFRESSYYTAWQSERRGSQHQIKFVIIEGQCLRVLALKLSCFVQRRGLCAREFQTLLVFIRAN